MSNNREVDNRVFHSVGVALTPRTFPATNADDTTDMFRLGGAVGDVAAFIYPWSQPNLLTAAATMVSLSQQHHLAPMLGLGVTTLGNDRKDLDVPPRVRAAAGPNPSFAQAVVRNAFFQDVASLAALKPPYLCLATEINFLGIANPAEYAAFTAAYKVAYALVKQISPETNVFVSFQWDVQVYLDVVDPNSLAGHTALIDAFRPQLDAIVLTSYPSGMYATPADMPTSYYQHVYAHVRTDEPVMFMEMGWPTEGSGTEADQVAFIQRLPDMLSGIRPLAVVWALLHDISVLPGDQFRTGLRASDGRPKLGYEAFSQLQHATISSAAPRGASAVDMPAAFVA